MCYWHSDCYRERPDDLCPECASQYEDEVNPNSAWNRTLRAACVLEAATPATDEEWQAWRLETTTGQLNTAGQVLWGVHPEDVR